ncbi:MAG: UDP-N-acetylmuramate dehydrogenase [Lachnospiraceae bacterium]|nr:UDP-N-acetylmuramate dehydrogenase [Lachnospiraceae bacterium]
MNKHTTFKVGGQADVFVIPQSIEEAADIIRLLLSKNEPYTVIGNGSNILVSDRGYRGCIVCMDRGTDSITVKGTSIRAEAGAMLSKVANAAYENSLTGLEFASGIPGTVGGAMVMNAGAYGFEMKDVTVNVTLFDAVTGEVKTLPAADMEFGYRTSIVKKHPYTVLAAEFLLTAGNREEIKAQMDELAQKRRQKQPLEYPSAGSTFKRPEGFFAGKLIEDAGLKGYSVGGAAVSEKHCGFVINKGGATATDVIRLMNDVKDKVYEKFGVCLEPEVVMIGEEKE